MPVLRPFRDYDEHDVINLFRLDNASTLPVSRGTLVKLADNTGWQNSQELDMLGSAGEYSISNVVAQRYGVEAEVTIAGAGDQPIGWTLYDVAELDENGEKLIYNPRKAVEIECVLSGQAVPIVTRGVFLYSGATLAGETVNAGVKLYAGAAGELTVDADSGTNMQVGYALGGKDSGSNHVLVNLDIRV